MASIGWQEFSMPKLKKAPKAPKLTFIPKAFGPDTPPPREGQRVRFAPSRVEDGGHAALYSASADRVIYLRKGALCDVVEMDGAATVTVAAYIKREDGTVETHTVAGVDVGDFVNVRGRPFVAGVDDRRHDFTGSGDSEGDSEDGGETPPAPEPRRAVPSGTTRPKVTAVPRSPAPAIPDAAAQALRDLLGTGGLDEDAVRAIAEDVTASAVDPLGTAVAEIADSVVVQANGLKDVNRKLTDVLDVLATASPAVRARVRVAVTGGKSSGNAIADALARWYVIGEDRGANVLLASPPSLGKSYAVREFGRLYDCYLEHGCSDDVDEIATLLGSPMPDGHGSFIVVDGVLTQAVRTAGSGKSVLLLLDEILRLSSRAQEWLLSFLTGRKRADGSRYYELRTRRTLPDGTLETLTCDAGNLHIVAATNLGMLPPIEAFWSRWETVRFQFDPATVRAVSTAVLAAFGHGDAVAGKLAGAWTAVVTESRKEVAKGTLRFPADIRMLERACAVTAGGAQDVARLLAGRLVDNLANWSADLGDTDPESAKVCEKWTTALNSL
jgi:hypothetical protein